MNASDIPQVSAPPPSIALRELARRKLSQATAGLAAELTSGTSVEPELAETTQVPVAPVIPEVTPSPKTARLPDSREQTLASALAQLPVQQLIVRMSACELKLEVTVLEQELDGMRVLTLFNWGTETAFNPKPDAETQWKLQLGRRHYVCLCPFPPLRIGLIARLTSFIVLGDDEDHSPGAH